MNGIKILSKDIIKEIKELARVSRQIASADTYGSDSFDFAYEFSENFDYLASKFPEIKSLKVIEGVFITDRKFYLMDENGGYTTNEKNHCWITINDEIIIDIGSDLFNDYLMNTRNKRIEIRRITDSRYKEKKIKVVYPIK